MSLKLNEAVKAFLSDIENFLTDTLKSSSVSKAIAAEKDELLKKLKTLRSDFPQLSVELREKAPETVKPAEREEKVESQEIYDDIGGDIGGDDNKSVESIKLAASSTDVSEAQTLMSAGDLTVTASVCGNLNRKNIGKSNLKNLFSSMFGKKYCVINGGVFFIFEKMQSKKPSYTFPIKGYEARPSVDQSTKKEFCFEVVCPGDKSYLFGAASQEEMDKWISVIGSESLRVPDAHLSMFFGKDAVAEDEDDLEYEDPTPMNTVKSQPPSKGKPAAPAPAHVDFEEEVYDDVASPPDANPSTNGDGEIYDDGMSKATEIMDELYEDYDDVQAAVQAVISTPPSKTEVQSSKASDKDAEVAYDKMYYGKWDCKGDDIELTFKRGDIIEIISQEYDKFGWWVGTFKGTIGLVPRDYMTPAYELVVS